jgi:3',5'-cyclic AMP phosphodiesterase CpdA
MAPITLLHLSDLHLGNDFIPRALASGRIWWKKVSPRITDGLIQAIRDTKPDYIVISGDFVNKQQGSSFWLAAQYLKHLFGVAGFDMKERLLVVPGNHDVSFAPKKHTKDDLRLWMYRRFLMDLFDETDLDARRHRFLKVDIDQKLLFLCLDTSLKSAVPKAEGEIGINQLKWVARKLSDLQMHLGSSLDDFVKIAVMHHHPVGIVGQDPAREQFMQLLDAEDILQILDKYGFNLLLHGHKHVPRMTTRLRADSGSLTIIGAGTATCPYLEEQGGSGNNFNLISILPAENQGTLYRLKANSLGVFEREMEKPFSLFAVPRGGYSTRRFRKVVQVEKDGTTITTVERRELRTHAGLTMRTLPLKIVATTPGAKIAEFKLMCKSGTVKWRIREELEYDGEFEFHSPLMDRSDPADIIYRYRILNGIAMSAQELRKRFEKEQIHPLESTSVLISGSAGLLEIVVTFPQDFHPSGKPRMSVKMLGAPVNLDLKHRPNLAYDFGRNSWTLSVSNPPLNHSISLEWDLPDESNV